MTARISSMSALAVGIAALAIVVMLAVVVGGNGRDEFGGGSVDALTEAFEAQGLTICDGGFTATRRGEGGAVSTQEVELGSGDDCATTIVVQVDAFEDAAHRDAAAREAEARLRPRAAGVVFTWRQFTIYLQADEASGDPGIRDRIVDALDAVGAS